MADSRHNRIANYWQYCDINNAIWSRGLLIVQLSIKITGLCH